MPAPCRLNWMMKRITSITVSITLLLLLAACSNKEPRYKQVELSKSEKTAVDLERYEQDLFSIPVQDLRPAISELQEEYAFFLGEEKLTQQQLLRLREYLNDPLIIELYDQVEKVYPDNQWLSEHLSSLFSYYSHYFPGENIPTIYTYVSGIEYEQPVSFTGDVLIIALDMYLGSDFKPYQKAGLPAYRRLRLEKQYLPVDIAIEIASRYQPTNIPKGKLLDRMVWHGKQHYFTDALVPDAHDSTKIKYSPSQLSWIQNNEEQLWAFIIENELLFSGQHSKYKKLLSEGPFTADFGKDSPPRIAHWIGWQIVRSFMEENPDVTLKQLMAITDSRTILEKSGYKP